MGSIITQGYHAISSLKEYGPRAFRQLKEEAILENYKTAVSMQ